MSSFSNSELDLFDAFSVTESASECLVAAYDALDNAVDSVLKRIFHKDDSTIKFVVDPLLNSDGPLGDIMLRAKLLLGFGVISKTIYDDIEVFVTLREWARLEENNVEFTDVNIVFELNKVAAIQQIMPIDYQPEKCKGMSDDVLEMSLIHYNQKVKSTLVLAITEIVNQLGQDNLLMSSASN